MFANVISNLEWQRKSAEEEIKRADAERINALMKMERAEKEVAEHSNKRDELTNAINLLKINEGIVNRAGHDLPPIPSPDTQGGVAQAVYRGPSPPMSNPPNSPNAVPVPGCTCMTCKEYNERHRTTGGF